MLISPRSAMDSDDAGAGDVLRVVYPNGAVELLSRGVRIAGASAPAHDFLADCLADYADYVGLPGVDVNLQDEDGDTALRHTAFKGAWRCVKVLLADHRVDVNLSNNNGCNIFCRKGTRLVE